MLQASCSTTLLIGEPDSDEPQRRLAHVDASLLLARRQIDHFETDAHLTFHGNHPVDRRWNFSVHRRNRFTARDPFRNLPPAALSACTASSRVLL